MSTRPLSLAAALLVILSGAAVGWWLGVRVSADRPAVDLAGLELPTLGGSVDGPGRHPGQVSLLEYWASWCGPCKVQAKVLAPLHQEFGDRVRFFAVNVGESSEQVSHFLEAEPIPYPVLLDEHGEHASDAGVFGLPTVVLLDADGRVVLRSEGITTRQRLLEALHTAMGASVDAPSAGS